MAVWVIGFCLGVLLLAQTARLYALRKSIRLLAQDMKEINGQLDADEMAGRQLNVECPDAVLQNLAAEMNRYMESAFAVHNRQEQREKRLREEITGISHDFRTPLTGILGYLELMEEEALSGEQREYLDVVKRRAGYLNRLIGHFYDYSRLENHELALENNRLDFRKLFQEHILEFYGEFERNGTEVSLSLPEGPVWVRGDAAGLDRIFCNLTSNCLKYGRDRAEIELRRSGDLVQLSYRNPAGPLTGEDVARLFDRFYQKDPARSGSGSGLGLCVAKLLAERMGGRLDAALEDGCLAVRLEMGAEESEC